MKKIGTVLLFLFIAATVRSQYVELDTDTMPAQRNWVGINFTTLVSYATYAIPVNPHVGINFRRQLTISKNLRLGANYYHYDPENDFSREAGTFIIGDSATSYASDTDRWNAELRGGLEWFKPGKQVSPVYGVEFVGGYEVEREFRRENYSVRDTALCPTCFLPDPGKAPIVFEQETGYTYVGFALSFGFQFRIRNHSAFTLQFSPEFTYIFPVTEYSRDQGGFFLPPVAGLRPAIHPLEFFYSYNF